MKTASVILLTLLLIGASAAITFGTTNSHSIVTPNRSRKGRGLIKGIDTSAKVLDISHNTIPHIMMAMRMRYPIAKASMLNGLAVGDSVIFTLSSKDGNYLVTRISKIEKLPRK